ncbi:MAG: 30S ribosomal protein S20 [Planctomycetes bacterium]|nr:30S ribosomal protein S20 [Planctomycetota bacterium]
MAHSRSAKKRVRQAETRRGHNREIKAQFRSQVKKVLGLISTKGEGLEKEFRTLVGWLDKAASKRVIHRNTASRYKARISARVAAAAVKK